jgi:dTMP kinase
MDLHQPRPRLIAFEGVDGAGKSTALEHVAAALRARGLAVHRPRVGKRHRSRPARAIRDLSRDVANLDLCPRAELALYCAREAQVLSESVVPALARGEIVLLDRGLMTPVVLGSWGRGLPLADCEAMATAARGDCPVPELTLVFDVDPRTARQRKQIGKIRSHGFREGGRKGLAGSAFKARIRAGYQGLAARDASMHLLVDERDDPEQVTARVLAILDGEPSDPERDARPWWRIGSSVDLDRELDVALDQIPEPLAIYLSRGLALARSRRADAQTRERALVAWALDRTEPLRDELALDPREAIHALAGLRRVPLGDDDLRLRCAGKVPEAVARSLVGVSSRIADVLRRALVATIPGQADQTKREGIAGGLVASLAGREDAFAFELRALLWPEADSFDQAASLRGCSGPEAEALRAALFDSDPARALDSLRGVEPELADARLEFYAATAPKPVLRALVGRGDPRAHALRARVAATGSEVVESVAGLLDDHSFDLREAALDAWPLGVVKSLVGVPPDHPRAQACRGPLRARAQEDIELHCALLRLEAQT